MKLTHRDIQLVKDIALSHVLSRDQVIRLGYFTSISRTNRRLKALVDFGFVRIHATPFFHQNLYWVGPESAHIVGDRIQTILKGRVGTPRFIQHSLSVTEVRLALLGNGGEGWRFEAQLWSQFTWAGQRVEVRPDGLIHLRSKPTFIEVDLGNCSLKKFGAKLQAYAAYAQHGNFQSTFNVEEVRILVVTSTTKRAKVLARQAPGNGIHLCVTNFEDLGIIFYGGWS